MITLTKIKAEGLDKMADYLCPASEELDEQLVEEQALGRRAGYYYSGKELANPKGFFAGKLAEEWGLEGKEVTNELFKVIGQGYHPITKKRLVAAAQGTHVVAYDMTASLPKGISLAWVAADSEGKQAIEQDFRASIMDILGHVEEQGEVVRRKIDGRTVTEKSAGMVFGCFEHFSSRETEELEAPDVNLHYHLIAYSVAKRQSDKLAQGRRYREHGAVEMRSLATMKVELDALLQTKLQQRLEARGIQTVTQQQLDVSKAELSGEPLTRDKNRNFHVLGFTARSVVLKWSRRTAQVDKNYREALIAKGFDPDGPIPRRVQEEAHELAKVKGRREKRVPAFDLLDQWRARLLADGISLQTFKDSFTQRIRRQPSRDQVLEGALARMPDFGAVMPWWRLRALVSEEAVYQGMSGDATKDLIDASYRAEREGEQLHPDLVTFQGRVTSRSWAAREKSIVGMVEKIAKNERLPLTAAVSMEETAKQVLARINVDRAKLGKDPINLGKDQLTALKSMWGQPDQAGHRVNLAIGQAGSGKTLVCEILVEGHRQGAKQLGGKAKVIAVSVARDRAVAFGRSIGADQTLSFEGFDKAIPKLELDEFSLVAIDEACMTDSKRLLTLLRVNPNISLLAVGDPQQLGSIGAGGAAIFQHFEKVAGQAVMIDEILRTKDESTQLAWKAMRNVKTVEQAVEHYQKKLALRFFETDKQAELAMMDEWEQRWSNRPRAVKELAVICDRSNRTIDSLNAEATARLRHSGELKGEGAKVVWHDPQDRNYVREQTLYAGSYVTFTRNMTVKSTKGELAVQNSERGFVRQIEHDESGRATKVVVDVLRPSSPQVTLTSQTQISNLRCSWVTHTFREQGGTYRNDLILQGRGTSNRNAYVAVTRVEEEAIVFQSDESLNLEEGAPEAWRIAELTRQWKDLTEQESAITFVEAADAAAEAEEQETQDLEREPLDREAEFDELLRHEDDERYRRQQSDERSMGRAA